MHNRSTEYTSAPFTSGQTSSWLLFFGSPTSPTGVMRAERWIFPKHAPEGYIRDAVQHIVERHEVLRTTVGVDPSGLLEQRVHAFRPVEIDFYDRGDVTVDTVRDVTLKLLQESIDVTEQWPARWVLGRFTSDEHFLILLVHHFALGARGGRVIWQELAHVMDNLCHGRPGTADLPDCMNPRDFLAEELSKKGERARERARENTRDILRSMPSTPFPMDLGKDPADDVPRVRGRMITGELRSPALRGRLDRLSEQWAVPVSAIVLTVLSVALRRTIPEGNALAWQIYSDRAGTGRQNAAGFEPFISLVSGADLPDVNDLHTATRTMWSRMLRALRNQAYGEDVLVEEAFRVSQERRVKVHCPFGFNYIGFSTAECYEDASVGRGEGVPDADTIDVKDCDDTPGAFFNCFVSRLPKAMKISLYLHEDMLGGNRLSDLLRYIADILYNASSPLGSEPASAVPLRAVRPQKDWVFLPGNRWVKPKTVSAALNSLKGVQDVQTESVDDGKGRLLLVKVRSTDASMRPDDLREACMGLLDVPGFAVPDAIEITCAPSFPSEPARPSPALNALMTAVRRVVPSGDWDARKCYFATGGRLSAVPAVLHELTKSGWDGLAREDLCSHRPLVEVAGTMYRRSWQTVGGGDAGRGG